MSVNLKTTFPILWLMSNVNNKDRKRLLKELSKKKVVYNAVAEIANNKLKGNLDEKLKEKLNSQQLKRLNSHNKLFKKLCCKQKCKKSRSKLLSQTGGALPLLIPIIADILGSKIKDIFSNG
jgi:hypothetical protein